MLVKPFCIMDPNITTVIIQCSIAKKYDTFVLIEG